jgi:hypothetical protein
MSKLHNAVVISCCMTFSVIAGAEISLSGTVKDAKGFLISGALLTLASNASIKDTSSAGGEFAIGNSKTAINNGEAHGISAQSTNNICIKENQLRFSISSPAHYGVVSIFSSTGQRTLAMPLDKMKSGIHKLTLPKFAAGFSIMHIAIDKAVIVCNLVNTGSGIFMSNNGSGVANISQGLFKATASNVDTLVVTRNAYKTVKKAVPSYKQTGIAIVMTAIPVKDLPSITEMPDPLTMLDGTKVTTQEQWKARRREMIQILEDYEYGHMPPPPGNVKATVATALSRVTVSTSLKADYRMMHLTFGPGEKLNFDLGLFIPVDSTHTVKQFPVLIYVTTGTSKTSLSDASAALSRGYAVATINYSQLGADSKDWNKSAFYPSYPDYDWRDFSAWAWGISRAVDYLVTDSIIDKEKIMVTGVSRCGQPALLVGAFDERIALAAPVAGGMALRFSGKEMGGGKGQGITEVVDQGTYWFGPRFEEFRNLTPKLPCDQHWLVALTAPRLSIMCNSFADQYGRAYAAVQTYMCAKPVYTFLNADVNVGLNFREGQHGMQPEDWSALMDFADQKLLNKAGTRKFDVIPPADKTP